MSLRIWQYRSLLLAAAVGSVFATSALALDADTAYIPFVVNVDATVRAEREIAAAVGEGTLIFRQMTVKAGEINHLHIPLQKATGIANGAKKQTAAPAVVSSRGGNVSVNLTSRTYRNADISLYSVKGIRVFRKTVSSAVAENAVTRRDIAAGAYLLSVRDADGGVAAARLTHSGGSLNIRVISGADNRSATPRLSKQAEDAESWTIKISSAGWEDSTYAIVPVGGINQSQNIKLRSSYPWTKIGGVAWMAKNLNTKTDSSWCYGGADSNCTKYGRLYAWTAAQTACPSGTHLPTYDEWVSLITATGATRKTDFSGIAFDRGPKKLFAASGWDVANIQVTNGGIISIDVNGTDELGFSALPGGKYELDSHVFKEIGVSGRWWTATLVTNDRSFSYYALLRNNYADYIELSDTQHRFDAFSIRCVLD